MTVEAHSRAVLNSIKVRRGYVGAHARLQGHAALLYRPLRKASPINHMEATATMPLNVMAEGPHPTHEHSTHPIRPIRPNHVSMVLKTTTVELVNVGIAERF